MLKREDAKRPGWLAVTLAASLAASVTPALTAPSVAGSAGGLGTPSPVQGAPWLTQGGQAPLQGMPQFFASPRERSLLDGLTRLDPPDIALAGSRRSPVVLWRDQPVELVDVRDALNDNEIGALLDALDSDPAAGDSADGLTGFLQQEGVLPDYVDVVGLDLLDSPPTLFVLPN